MRAKSIYASVFVRIVGSNLYVSIRKRVRAARPSSLISLQNVHWSNFLLLMTDFLDFLTYKQIEKRASEFLAYNLSPRTAAKNISPRNKPSPMNTRRACFELPATRSVHATKAIKDEIE